MAALRYIVPALAVAGRAAAQCSAATTTIQSAGDATALAGCQTFTGTIAIATGTTDDIALDGIDKIEGSLIANNVTGISTLSGTTLTTITDMLSLSDLTVLNTLSFPSLTNVDTIDFNALPALQGLSFGDDGVQTASSVTIQNTELNSLTGINLETVDTFYIANNPFLNLISMQLANLTTSLTLEALGDDCVVELPNLIWANNMTFRDIADVTFPSLAAVNGSLGFFSDTFLNVSAPNLTSIGGSLSFSKNEDLTNVSLPLLTKVGGAFVISGSPEYKSISFPDLQTVTGALDFSGNFTSVSLPSLKEVQGAFNLQSSGDISSACTHFSSIHGSNNVIRGKYSCYGDVNNPGGAGTTQSSGSGGSSSSTSSSSNDGTTFYSQSYLTGVMGLVAAVFGLM